LPRTYCAAAGKREDSTKALEALLLEATQVGFLGMQFDIGGPRDIERGRAKRGAAKPGWWRWSGRPQLRLRTRRQESRRRKIIKRRNGRTDAVLAFSHNQDSTTEHEAGKPCPIRHWQGCRGFGFLSGCPVCSRIDPFA